MRNRETSFLKRSSDFKLIYDAANNDNRPALASLLDGSMFVDVQDHTGLFTPAAKLAAEKNHDAVAMLQACHASNDYIAMGYASAGLVDEAEYLLRSKGVNIKYLAIGAAMSESSKYAEKLRHEFQLNPAWLVFGAAFGGRFDYLKKLICLMPAVTPTSPVKDINLRNKMICAQIKGYILGGHITQAIAVLDLHANDETDLYLRVAIKAAARVGNEDLLKKLIVRNGRNPHVLDYYYSLAAAGAAKGGYINYARQLLNYTCESGRQNSGLRVIPKEEYLRAVLKAGMSHGHFNEVSKQFSSVKIDKKTFLLPQIKTSAFISEYSELAAFTAQHGDLKIAEDIYAKHKISLHGVVKAMDFGGHFYNEELLTYALTFVNNQDFLQALSVTAVAIGSDPQALNSVRTETQGWSSAFENKCFTEFKKCARRASVLHHFMQEYDLNYNQARALLDSPDLRLILRYTRLMNSPVRENVTVAAGLLAGLTVAESEDLIEKLMFHLASHYADKQLKDYYDRNYYSIRQHTNRAYDMRTECGTAKSRVELKSMIDFQHNLLKGDIIVPADKSKPKHKQPLTNPVTKDDDFLKTVDELKHNFRMN